MHSRVRNTALEGKMPNSKAAVQASKSLGVESLITMFLIKMKTSGESAVLEPVPMMLEKVSISTFR